MRTGGSAQSVAAEALTVRRIEDSARASVARVRKAFVLLTVLLIAVVAAIALSDGGFVKYRLRNGSTAASPSLLMDVSQLLGLRDFNSQLGQDKWILGEVHSGVRDGYFVDVGSWDAVKHSNSKALEDAGWEGVCADPFPRNWEGRRCQLFREVIYGKRGEVVRFRTAGITGGIEQHVDQSRPRVRDAGVVELTTTTLGDVLERAGAPAYIHYLSIDTEGSEYEILAGFPFDTYRVGAFTVEHNYEEPKRTRIRELLESHGYRLSREQLVDDWYVFDDESHE